MMTICIYVCNILFLFSLIGTGNICAQKRWLPKLVSIKIPMKIGHEDLSNGITTFKNEITVYGADNNPANYNEHGDTISMSGPDSIYIFGGISFVLDTIKKNISNFYDWYSLMHYSHQNFYDEITEGYRWFLSLLPMEYTISGDTISIFESGQMVRDHIDTVDWTYSNYDFYNAPRAQSYTGYQESMYSLLDDTASFQCSIILIHTEHQSEVPNSSFNKQIFYVSMSFPDRSINFSFPTSEHVRRITIYDILGREVSKIEIPAGRTSYEVSSAEYPRGTFFARLGSQTVHFIKD